VLERLVKIGDTRGGVYTAKAAPEGSGFCVRG
jgi:hypothetical protein